MHLPPPRKKLIFQPWLRCFAWCWILITEVTLCVDCLKDLKIFVPDAVIMGNAATLSCQYDLEQATLYSVRWYFGAEEFYRYVPKETPPTLVFPVSGINVDLANSDATSVTLKGVTRELTGNYQCEVSEDAPLFHTDIRSAHMQVIELPKDDPAMQVDKKIITANDNFKAVCTIGPSYPPANITWYINGRKVYKTPFQRITHDSYEGSATYSSLEIYPHSQVLQGFFQAVPKYPTSILLLCEVSILHVFHKNVQQRLMLSIGPPSTISPNLLGLEGSKRMNSGDPDNSPLTGRAMAATHVTAVISPPFLVLLIPLMLLFQQYVFDCRRLRIRVRVRGDGSQITPTVNSIFERKTKYNYLSTTVLLSAFAWCWKRCLSLLYPGRGTSLYRSNHYHKL